MPLSLLSDLSRLLSDPAPVLHRLEATGLPAILCYAILFYMFEVLCVPSTPLTILAGHLFNFRQGVLLVSLTSTAAAATAFLLARTLLRRRVRAMATRRFARFDAMDAALGTKGFRLVLLTRLSPLIPFALSSYVHGVTRVRFVPFIAATFIGMLPTTFTYVSIGTAAQGVLNGGKSAQSLIFTIIGLAATVGVVYVVGNAANRAVRDMEGAANGDIETGKPRRKSHTSPRKSAP